MEMTNNFVARHWLYLSEMFYDLSSWAYGKSLEWSPSKPDELKGGWQYTYTYVSGLEPLDYETKTPTAEGDDFGLTQDEYDWVNRHDKPTAEGEE